MQKTNFILASFILLFLCLVACQAEKKQNAVPCVSRDFNIENINPADSNTCETNGLCQGQIDSLNFEGKVLSALIGDTLITLNFVVKQQSYDYTTMSFSIDLRSNTLIDSTFYMIVKRNNNNQLLGIYKLEKNSNISTDCFQYDKQQQIILGSISKRKFVSTNPNPVIATKQIYIPELYFKANTKILKNPCILCG